MAGEDQRRGKSDGGGGAGERPAARSLQCFVRGARQNSLLTERSSWHYPLQERPGGSRRSALVARVTPTRVRGGTTSAATRQAGRGGRGDSGGLDGRVVAPATARARGVGQEPCRATHAGQGRERRPHLQRPGGQTPAVAAGDASRGARCTHDGKGGGAGGRRRPTIRGWILLQAGAVVGQGNCRQTHTKSTRDSGALVGKTRGGAFRANPLSRDPRPTGA